jgi:hypothetical protein
MRRDGSLNLLLNARLFKGMRCVAGPDPRYINFVILDEEKKPQSHLLRVRSLPILCSYYRADAVLGVV